jgi:hypothetical protein
MSNKMQVRHVCSMLVVADLAACGWYSLRMDGMAGADRRRVRRRGFSMFRGLKPQVSAGAGSLVIGNGNEGEGEKCSDGVAVDWRLGRGKLTASLTLLW